jgi:ABC-type transporter Mla subunit MlaD
MLLKRLDGTLRALLKRLNKTLSTLLKRLDDMLVRLNKLLSTLNEMLNDAPLRLSELQTRLVLTLLLVEVRTPALNRRDLEGNLDRMRSIYLDSK